MLPGQLLDARHTHLFHRLVFEIDRLQGTQRSAHGPDEEVDAGHDQVKVLGVGKVRDEGQDQAQRDPPGDVAGDVQRLGRHALPEQAHEAGKRLEADKLAGRAGLGDGKGFTDEAKTDVQQDESADDQRISANAAGCHLGEQEHVGAIAQRLAAEDETADQEVDHADNAPRH